MKPVASEEECPGAKVLPHLALSGTPCETVASHRTLHGTIFIGNSSYVFDKYYYYYY